ncbi:MAG: ABC transporter substrate-binding protein [Dehalococcoidales bacterium]|nr:ABC transporter substrate-binding protein [Dehalococcoidales bacterium]MDD4230564.1 ABC transporter substrate-binding protein [Dehalococcoidales bacterium]MDD4465654.1 ABC transporter substrate-binding protein [Dehalococcoidales bacterium]MDD5401869.1 ABC transporter substrate-binding protein [Dehalococcoidales bacterium]
MENHYYPCITRRGFLKGTGMASLVLFIGGIPFLVSACGDQKETIRLGLSTPSTGAAAEKGQVLEHGNKDAIRYINEEKGGVAGYEVELVWMDNGYNASSMVNNVNKFMDSKCLTFGCSSSAMMTAAMTVANQNGFTGLAVYGAPVIYRPPQHIYGQMPDYGDDFVVFAQYYKDNLWNGQGKPTVAMHLLNNSTGYGAHDGAKAKAAEMGFEILEPVFEHTASTTSETTSLNSIRALNPDILYIASTPKPSSVIIKNARELGMTGGDMVIACGHAGMTKALVDLAGADVCEGVYGLFPTVNWDDEAPGMAKVKEYCQKYHSSDYGNMDYIASWCQSLIMAKAAELAVGAVGYETLARGGADAWKAYEDYGIKALDNYDVEGLQGPVSYTPGDNRMSKSLRVFQVQNGNINPVTDWIEAPVIEYEKFDWFGKK